MAKNKNAAQDFADNFDTREGMVEIIAWANGEILEYKRLIEIVKKKMKSKSQVSRETEMKKVKKVTNV
jgi:hypothetical protein